ncbi:MAG: hypothetical protein GY832_19200 [Chloroflexi bacterium]|nr:hypothetical protein [Chloroflexota bacterium]
MFFRRCRFLIIIAVILIVLATLLIVVNACPHPKSQSWYKPYELSGDSWIAKRVQSYQEACDNRESWTKDPVDVALYVAGYPNIEGSEPDQINVFDIGSGRISVVIMEDSLLDDSIRSSQVRVDLAKRGDVWKVEWAGSRWRCWRTVFAVWGTNSCP